MQVYPSSWDTLLKSKNFLASPPFARLTFANTGDSHNYSNLTAWRTPEPTAADAGGVSPALKANGALIWVGLVGSEVYEGEVSTEAVLLGGDSTVTGWTGTGITNAGRATVWNLDGGLYLTVVDVGAIGREASTKVYSSASGNGGDWALHGTVATATGQDTWYPSQTALPAGKAVELSTGRWVLPTSYIVYDGAGKIERQGIFTSDNSGVNWTWRFDGPDYFGANRWQGSRQVAVHATSGNLYLIGGRTVAPYYRIYKSTDSGASWTWTYTLAETTESWEIANVGDEIIGFYNGNIHRWDDLDTDDTKTTLATPPANGKWTYLVEGSNYLLCCSENDVLGVPVVNLTLETPIIKSVDVDRVRGLISEARVVIDNKDGYYSRDLGDDDPGDLNEWHGIIKPGAEVLLEWGYGSNVVDAFTGHVGKPTRHRDSNQAELIIPIMGYLQWRGKKVFVTDGDGDEVGTIDNSTIEDAFSTVCQWHGWLAGEVHADATGVLLSAIPYEYEEVYDFLSKLGNWVGYDVFDDEQGDAHMRYPSDRQPYITGLKFTLNGTTAVDISDTTDDDSVTTGKAPIVLLSDTVTNLTGLTTYERDVDYTITQGDGSTEATLARTVGSSILDGQQVLVSYAYAAWIFEPPYIQVSSYDEDPTHLVRYIEVVSTDSNGDAISATYEYPNWQEYNLPSHSKRRYEVQGPAEESDCQDYANLLGRIMAATVRGQTVKANPWPCFLQVADVVQIIEKTSTSSELYRIDGYRAMIDGLEFYGELTAHHYAYAAEPS